MPPPPPNSIDVCCCTRGTLLYLVSIHFAPLLDKLMRYVFHSPSQVFKVLQARSSSPLCLSSASLLHRSQVLLDTFWVTKLSRDELYVPKDVTQVLHESSLTYISTYWDQALGVQIAKHLWNQNNFILDSLIIISNSNIWMNLNSDNFKVEHVK